MNIFSIIAVISFGVLATAAPSCPDPYGEHAYAHPDYCDQFFLCTNGTLTLETCENGLLFDGKGAVYNHCNYNWAANCGDRKVDEARAVPYSTPGCEYQFGLYEAAHECSKHYIKCEYGVPHQEECTKGLAYDDKIHGCNWPDLLLEKCDPSAVVGFHCPAKVDPKSLEARFWPFPRFSNPSDPHSFFLCTEGNPRLIQCGEEKFFDPSTLTCEDAE